MFLIWALSLPQHAHLQRKLIDECKSIDTSLVSDVVVDLNVADRLPYLGAVIKEALQLYASFGTTNEPGRHGHRWLQHTMGDDMVVCTVLVASQCRSVSYSAEVGS